MKHPMQKIENGRFVKNAIVEYLLDNGGIDLNKLAVLPFDDEDREQFAQLIGYSVSGYQSLNYVSDESAGLAGNLCDNQSISEQEAYIKHLEETLAEAREGIKKAATAVFAIHPDDLSERPSA